PCGMLNTRVHVFPPSVVRYTPSKATVVNTRSGCWRLPAIESNTLRSKPRKTSSQPPFCERHTNSPCCVPAYSRTPSAIALPPSHPTQHAGGPLAVPAALVGREIRPVRARPRLRVVHLQRPALLARQRLDAAERRRLQQLARIVLQDERRVQHRLDARAHAHRAVAAQEQRQPVANRLH